jgi:hypothetical protein
LADEAKQIPALVLASKADNTNKKYKLYFDKFSRWCNLHGLLSLLARPASVCLYISSLVISANSLYQKNPEKPIKYKMQIPVRNSETFCKFLPYKLTMF